MVYQINYEDVNLEQKDIVDVPSIFERIMTRCLRFLLFNLLLNNIKAESTHEDGEEYRLKRQINSVPLVYPYGGTYKFIIGFSSPIPVKDHINLAFAANFQYQYLQFQNISELSQYYFIKEVSREQRDAELEARKDERLVFYRAVAEMLDTKGINGYDCVLRAICEAAQYPVEDDGLVGEVIHILLTPDYGRTPFDEDDPDYTEVMSPYVDAAVAGRQMFDCGFIYNKCPQGQGVLELISALHDE